MEQQNGGYAKKGRISIHLVLVMVLAVLLVIFTLQNQEKVSLKLFFWTIPHIPVALLIIVCLLLGYLIPYFALVSRIWKLKNELIRSKKENDDLKFAGSEKVVEKQKPDPEGILFDDEDENEMSGRFFKE